MAAPKRLFLIDGTALAYRAHFAFAMSARGGLSTASGQPTSAVYGFATTLIALLDREHPEAIAISFDGAREDLQRTAVFPAYKSTRAKMPEDLIEQLALIEELVAAWGIPVVRCPGHEADDVIGTLAVRARAAGMAVFLVTADKDFLQLVDDRIKLWNLRASTRSPEILGPAEVVAKFGVEAKQMVDLLALMGDASDNIPGVPRVGAKTAAELLQQFGTLESVLDHAGEVGKPSIARALRENREQALLSRDLVTLRTDVDCGVEVGELGPPAPDRSALEELLRRLEFESLLKSLPAAAVPEVATDYRVVRGDVDLRALLERLEAGGRCALAAEATGSDPMRSKLLGLAFSDAAGRGWYVPADSFAPAPAGAPSTNAERLRLLLTGTAVAKVLHDSKRQRSVLRTHGIELGGVELDSMLASYCLTPGVTAHDLGTLALRYLSHRKTESKDLVGSGRKQKTFADIAVEEVGRFAAESADLTWRLQEHLAPELEAAGVETLLHELEMPLASVLLDMEREGIAVDLDHLRGVGEELQRRIDALHEQLDAAAGEPFNPLSPAQVGEVLFGTLELHKAAGIARPKRTRTGQWRTDAAVLEELARHHHIPRLLLDYRQLTKLKGTYIDSLPAMVNPDTGRIHTTFNQAVAATGRLSSDNPNLQNIPIRTAEGREVRRAFIARTPGWVLLSADYSQIELRILAHMSGEEALIDSFRRREDIHARTAALVYGGAVEQVDHALRSRAKVVNYGLMYGMGASRLARETGMSPPEAKRFIKAYFAALPGVQKLLDDNLQRARATREAWTLFGRRRPLPDIDSTNAMQRVAAENMAVNTPIQGTAADIIKRAMLALHRDLHQRGLRARLLLQVHDELVLDVPEDELEQVSGLVRGAMGGAADLEVPLEVTVGAGRDWLAAHAG